MKTSTGQMGTIIAIVVVSVAAMVGLIYMFW